MTTKELNNAVDDLMERADGYADVLTRGLGKVENHERLLNALMEACDRELQHLGNYTRPLRLQEEAAESRMEHYREAA